MLRSVHEECLSVDSVSRKPVTTCASAQVSRFARILFIDGER
jgi:hypothetical protein